MLLVAINSKYVHYNIAIRSIAAKFNLKFYEYLITSNNHDILSDIILSGENIVGFSCYIWNIKKVIEITKLLKLIKPEIKIVYGGPEADDYPFIDYYCIGEGENAYFNLLEGKQKTKKIKGEKADLNEIPFLYTDEELKTKRLFYYESSRGCPFSCIFCLSHNDNDVRYKNIEIVKSDIKRFAEAGVKTVKFIDRTFNSDISRAKDILLYIQSLRSDTVFHFEISPNIVDKEFIEILSKTPNLRLEIGLQTVNERALKEINRKGGNKILDNIKLLIDTGAVVHLDLIAGLPFEGFESFKNTFNTAYRLNPTELQLGFLKVLKNTPMMDLADKHEYIFDSSPPYEVCQNKYMSFMEFKVLKDIENMVEIYKNSCCFNNILSNIDTDPFEFFLGLSKIYNRDNKSKGMLDKIRQFQILKKYLIEIDSFNEYDFLLDMALCNIWPKDIKILKISELINKDIGVEITKNTHKHSKLCKIKSKTLLVDYSNKKVFDLSKFFN